MQPYCWGWLFISKSVSQLLHILCSCIQIIGFWNGSPQSFLPPYLSILCRLFINIANSRSDQLRKLSLGSQVLRFQCMTGDPMTFHSSGDSDRGGEYTPEQNSSPPAQAPKSSVGLMSHNPLQEQSPNGPKISQKASFHHWHLLTCSQHWAFTWCPFMLCSINLYYLLPTT